MLSKRTEESNFVAPSLTLVKDLLADAWVTFMSHATYKCRPFPRSSFLPVASVVETEFQ